MDQVEVVLGSLTNPKFNQALSDLLKEKLPLRTAFKLKGLVKMVGEEQAKFDELRNAIVEDCAKKDEKGELEKSENGQMIMLREDKLPEFNSKMNELQGVKVSLPKISLADLGNVSMKVEDLLSLDFITE